MMRQRLECYLRMEGCLVIVDIRNTDWLFKIIWCESAITLNMTRRWLSSTWYRSEDDDTEAGLYSSKG